jgi:hypothetical protein
VLTIAAAAATAVRGLVAGLILAAIVRPLVGFAGIGHVVLPTLLRVLLAFVLVIAGLLILRLILSALLIGSI